MRNRAKKTTGTEHARSIHFWCSSATCCPPPHSGGRYSISAPRLVACPPRDALTAAVRRRVASAMTQLVAPQHAQSAGRVASRLPVTRPATPPPWHDRPDFHPGPAQPGRLERPHDARCRPSAARDDIDAPPPNAIFRPNSVPHPSPSARPCVPLDRWMPNYIQRLSSRRSLHVIARHTLTRRCNLPALIPSRGKAAVISCLPAA